MIIRTRRVLFHLSFIEPGECTDGSVRLSNGLIEQEGRVDVCVNGVWGSVCGEGWDQTDAHVVCGQLGYPEGGTGKTSVSTCSFNFILHLFHRTSIAS